MEDPEGVDPDDDVDHLDEGRADAVLSSYEHSFFFDSAENVATRAIFKDDEEEVSLHEGFVDVDDAWDVPRCVSLERDFASGVFFSLLEHTFDSDLALARWVMEVGG